MTVAPIAARAAASGGGRAAATRAGSGQVIDVTPTASRPLRAQGKTRTADVATGAGLGQLADGARRGRSGSPTGSSSSARRVLVAEFIVCMVVLAFSPITDKHREESPGAFMKRASATMGVFLILGLISTGGRGASRAAAGFGGLMTLVLLISQRSIFTVLATKFGKGVGEEKGLEEVGEGISGIIGDVIEEVKPDGVEAVPILPRPSVGAGIR